MRTNLTLALALFLSLSDLSATENKFTESDTISGKHLDNIIVTGTRVATPLSRIPMTISVINNNTIVNSYEPSLLPILNEHVPGLFITGRGVMGYGVSTGASGGIKMRGIGGEPSTGMLVLIDGNPQYMGLMGHPIADAYQSLLADRVEVVRGPASVVYGSNAMGGVINILTKKDLQDGVYSKLRIGYGSYNTLTTEILNMIRHNRFSSVLTGSYNRSDGHRQDMNFEQFGGYTKLSYKITENWHTYGELNITHFNASNPGTTSLHINDNDSHITRGIAGIAIENQHKYSTGAVKIFYNWGRHKINDGYPDNGQPLDYRFNSKDFLAGINAFQRISLFENNNMTLGFDITHFGGKAWNHNISDGKNTVIRDTTQYEIAGYININQQLTNRLNINGGIRYDYHSQCGGEWIPQGGISIALPKDTELKVSVAKGFRFPTIREMYMFPPQNPDLKPESIVNYEISYNQRLINNKMNYNLNLFLIDGDNLIQTIMVNGKPINKNTGKVNNWGLEATLNYHINHNLQISSNYSFLHMKYPVVAAPQHKWNLQGIYKRKHWSSTADVMLVKGLYTDIASAHKENYIMLNLSADYNVNKAVKVFVKAENLLSQKYEINKGYPMPKTTVFTGIDVKF